MSLHYFVALLSVLLSLVSAADAAHDAKHGPAAHHAPPKQYGVISLDVYRDGAVLHLLTAEADAKRDARQLLYRQSTDGGRSWNGPVRVDSAPASIYDLTRGNDAQIAASGQRVLTAWTAKGSGWQGSGPLMTAISIDGGKTWRAGGNPVDDAATSGHAYTELNAATGAFDAVWLDGRDGAQGLRHARSRDGVQWEKNTTVQSNTCECCWQSLARRNDDLLVMFRGKDPRDMQLSALPRGATGWASRGRVGRFDWDFKGCPHTGGALAATAGANALHAVVWTGANAAQGLHHLMSRDGGATWNATRRLGSQDAQRADIAISDDGKTLAAVWDQLEGSQRLIYTAYTRDEGKTWSAPRRLSATHVDAIYPRVVPIRGGFLALWTESKAEGSRVINILKTTVFDAQQNVSR
ncbi:MAG TPA: sialidase family protein [Burkholderiales bacterium]|nr:sialidase family protein [Burkholderiales bacterium]